jgi:predicted PurR-regulated permease PerM
MDQEKYVKNFNWLENWIDRHFFNKVSDTLLGTLFICFLIYILFRSKKKKKNQKKKIITNLHRHHFTYFRVVFEASINEIWRICLNCIANVCFFKQLFR